MNWNGAAVHEKGYVSERITDKAVEFLSVQKADAPFLLVVSYPNALPPYDGQPEKDFAPYSQYMFQQIPRGAPSPNAAQDSEMLKDTLANQRKAAAAIAALDDQIAVLQNALLSKGLRDNTLVVFTSACGALLGNHGLWGDGAGSNPPNMYEQAIRVPLIWSWFGKIPVEAMRPEVVSLYDVFPTLCAAAGAAVPTGRKLCGRSFLPLAKNQPMPKKQTWPKVFFAEYRNTEMARDERFKLVLRDGGKGTGEFYDLVTDPGELRNQYDNDSYVTIRDEFTKDLAAWRKATS